MMIYLFAPTQRHADYWCRHISTIPISPNNNKAVRILTASSGRQNLLGFRLAREDRVVIYDSAGVQDLNVKERRNWHDLMGELDRMEQFAYRKFEDREYVR